MLLLVGIVGSTSEEPVYKAPLWRAINTGQNWYGRCSDFPQCMITLRSAIHSRRWRSTTPFASAVMSLIVRSLPRISSFFAHILKGQHSKLWLFQRRVTNSQSSAGRLQNLILASCTLRHPQQRCGFNDLPAGKIYCYTIWPRNT